MNVIWKSYQSSYAKCFEFKSKEIQIEQNVLSTMKRRLIVLICRMLIESVDSKFLSMSIGNNLLLSIFSIFP